MLRGVSFYCHNKKTCHCILPQCFGIPGCTVLYNHYFLLDILKQFFISSKQLGALRKEKFRRLRRTLEPDPDNTGGGKQ